MARFENHFTLEEAQRALPWVRGVFAKIHRLIEMLQGGSSGPIPPGKSPLGKWENLLSTAADGDRRKLIDGMLQAMVGKGIVIQDIHRGLIDFPAWRGGEEVLLCYELSDGDRIQYWHDLESGFAGRQEIESGEFA